MTPLKTYSLVGWIRFRPGGDDLGIPVMSGGDNALMVPETDKALAIVNFHQFYNEQSFEIDFDLPIEFSKREFSVGDKVPIPFRLNGRACVIEAGPAATVQAVFGDQIDKPILRDLVRILTEAEQGADVLEVPNGQPTAGTNPFIIPARRDPNSTFYRGVAPGTWGSTSDARLTGISPRNPGSAATVSAMINRINNGITTDPFISVVRSYAVARQYAFSGRFPPSSQKPGYVYELELTETGYPGCQIVDPLIEITSSLRGTMGNYHHDGDMNAIMGLVDPMRYNQNLIAPVVTPPGNLSIPRAPHISSELEAIVRILRDTELLVIGNIPAACVVARFDVY